MSIDTSLREELTELIQGYGEYRESLGDRTGTPISGTNEAYVDAIEALLTKQVEEAELIGGIDELARLVDIRQSEGREKDHHGIKLRPVIARIKQLQA